MFALSQLPKDEGVPKLIDVARTNRDPAVPGRAIFWLGHIPGFARARLLRRAVGASRQPMRADRPSAHAYARHHGAFVSARILR